MVGFHGKPLCFCGSDSQTTGSQFLHVQDNIRGLADGVYVPVLGEKLRTDLQNRTKKAARLTRNPAHSTRQNLQDNRKAAQQFPNRNIYAVWIGPQPYPVIYVVANPVRGLLDRKRSEEHLQSSNESTKKNITEQIKAPLYMIVPRSPFFTFCTSKYCRLQKCD